MSVAAAQVFPFHVEYWPRRSTAMQNVADTQETPVTSVEPNLEIRDHRPAQVTTSPDAPPIAQNDRTQDTAVRFDTGDLASGFQAVPLDSAASPSVLTTVQRDGDVHATCDM